MTRRARDGGLYFADGLYDAARPRWGIVFRGWTHRGRVGGSFCSVSLKARNYRLGFILKIGFFFFGL